MPSVSAEDAPKLRPYMRLAEQLGAFAGQITHSGIKSVAVEYEGHAATLNVKPLNNMLLLGLLRPSLDSVNMVNAPVIAKERGIKLSETKRNNEGDYQTLIRLKIETESGTVALAGTLFSGKPRLVTIDDVPLEAEMTPHMLFVRNEDKPGMIGRIGTKLGEARINIANFNLGRTRPDANAVCLVSVDGVIPPAVLADMKALPHVVDAHALIFAAAFDRHA
jgi:D-3-phosphoglycerate dehydrogenase